MTPMEFDRALAEHMGRFYNKPYDFVMFSFPWGQKGTPLEHHAGPDKWQKEILLDLEKHITDNMGRFQLDLDRMPWSSAAVSGHGVGKSAFVSWLILFFMATRVDCRGVVTANTEGQLNDKTWPELSKWHSLFIARHWFQWTATQFYYKLYPEDKRKNYCFDAIPWSAERPEAFAGLHNETSSVVVIFDEASGVHDKIWEVAEGAMTDGEPFWFAFGNGTRADGRFYECFNRFRNFWNRYHVDSRSVRITNKIVLQGILDKFGEDSDEARVRVKGQFPRGSADGYITPEEVDAAMHRDLYHDEGAALIMAVDVARFGNDKSVIRFRQGNDMRSIKKKEFAGLDTQQLAAKVADCIDFYDPDATVVEGSGVGGGVVDALKARGYKVIEVNPGKRANNENDYQNIRAEMYGKLREWLRKSGCIPDDEPDLIADLTKVRYTYDNKNRLLLESKRDMKDRGLPSPDDGDSAALTFCTNIARRDRGTHKRGSKNKVVKGIDYDLFG